MVPSALRIEWSSRAESRSIESCSRPSEAPCSEGASGGIGSLLAKPAWAKSTLGGGESCSLRYTNFVLQRPCWTEGSATLTLPILRDISQRGEVPVPRCCQKMTVRMDRLRICRQAICSQPSACYARVGSQILLAQSIFGGR